MPSHGAAAQGVIASTLLSGRPAIRGVVFLDRSGDVGGFLAQVFLIDDAIAIQDESHDSGIRIFRGACDHCETVGDASIGYVVAAAALRGISLRSQNAEGVSIEYLRGPGSS